MIGGLGAIAPGPNLSTIGSKPYDGLPNDPEFLAKWLDNPAAQKPGTTMPRLGLTGAEIDALVAYLTNLK
jgi:cytochrome c1